MVQSLSLLPRRIVVGFDDHDRADAAIVTAWELATKLDARLEIVHAAGKLPKAWPGIDPIASMERNDKLSSSKRAAALGHLRQLIGVDTEAPFDLDEILRIEEGQPARVLLDEARLPTDLVVLGSHHQGGMLQFGGTLRTLLARSAGPLWIQSRPQRSFERILVPIDMSEHSLHALGLAVAFASRLRASVHVLHAFQPPVPSSTAWPEVSSWGTSVPVEDLRAAERSRFEEALSGFDWEGVQHGVSFVDGEPIETILEQAARHDLIAMGTHGRSGLSAVVLGSVTWRVIERSETPMLVTRLHDHAFVA